MGEIAFTNNSNEEKPEHIIDTSISFESPEKYSRQKDWDKELLRERTKSRKTISLTEEKINVGKYDEPIADALGKAIQDSFNKK